jgi:dolichol-phosphate mannosyltransferase
MPDPTLSIVIPCYNEEKTLEKCVGKVLAAPFEGLRLEIIIVDDCSRDGSYAIAQGLAARHPQVKVFRHAANSGKGAALHTGFRQATGDFVVVQDADLEYDPNDLVRLIEPLRQDIADVVFGSRFLSVGANRVLYFWHSLSNRILTLISNMLTDLNLTDMETCYKVFRRDVLQAIDLREKRFGFEPEVVAKVAQLRVRVYEMGISYYARTYAEGKKIGPKDGLRALYCILKYNLPRTPGPIQFCFYLFIGGTAALLNLLIFLGLHAASVPVVPAALTAFAVAAVANYVLSTLLIFRKNARWGPAAEYLIYGALVAAIGLLDSFGTREMILAGTGPLAAKLTASLAGVILNFLGRKYLVFYERGNPDWKPQTPG